MNSWLLFLYKVPHEPSSYRVQVWRRLKRLGALLLHDSVWALPETPRSLEQFQLLAVEIAELGGNSLLWEARLAVAKQDEALIQELLARLEPAYSESPVEVQ